ncbi:MAG: C-GCAxxG-C-C family protein [Firmicutes bacterium]|nr:C-GCAxxG-C-C family protein [Bacillota bacterium]
MNEVMDEILQRSHELRDDPNIHYNCAQGVFIPFAERKGLTAEQAGAITENFGGGMRMGMTCGAITGGLMALGLYGIGGSRDAVAFIQRISSRHEGRTQCRDLLSAEVKSPLEKKPHCDNMVYEAVLAVEEMLGERGIEI